VAGSVVKPENVFTSQVFNFVRLRLWFGGGELYAYAIDQNSNATLIDKVQIDLNRYGIPEVDQHKVILPPAKGPTEVKKPVASMPDTTGAGVDSTSASERLLSKPPPSGQPEQKGIRTDNPDSVSVQPRLPSAPEPGRKPPG